MPILQIDIFSTGKVDLHLIDLQEWYQLRPTPVNLDQSEYTKVN